MLRTLLLVGAVSALVPAQDSIRLATIFQDNMVLQREKKAAPLWGWATAGAKVTAKASWGAGGSAQADADGRFRLTLQTPGAGGPHTIDLSAGKATHQLKNVLLGDVWVCSGQSNMEMKTGRCGDGFNDVVDWKKEAAAGAYKRIRLFTVRNKISKVPERDCSGTWLVPTEADVRDFSAVGFFFGRILHREVGIPVGLISSEWGGTVCESWTSSAGLRKHGGYDVALDTLDASAQSQGDAARKVRAASRSWFEALEEKAPEGWKTNGFDASKWNEVAVPGLWKAMGLGDFDGIVRQRINFDLPSDWEGQELLLELGPIDDMDTTWFNGRRVGGMEERQAWNVPRRYVVPGASVKAQGNVIAIRVVDTGGGGGLSTSPDNVRLRLASRSDVDAFSLARPWRWLKGRPIGDLKRFPSAGRFGANHPTALYNGMIAPLVPLGITGAIWYQGESNRERGHEYRTLFPNMITDWRNAFGQGDFPFYFVQIAPYNYGSDTGQAAELREAQMMALKTKNTGMAITMDVGNPRDIHPKNKVAVGQRLAFWALARTYGKRDLAYSGPLYREAKVEGKLIRLHFDHARGLHAKEGKPSHFEIRGADGKWFAAEARIDGESIVVFSEKVATPVAARFAWGAADEPNLFNGAGLPASTFRTDG
ncbi:MAG: hypothetical protein CMJ83_07865 [Planctomycetes bacterium]|nr:hypothetical protein [Planctomycetota bacterium]